jgi:site-specific DNA-methyltransferase (cytosine-N4-specific)
MADARELPLSDGTVNCCVTSPPYLGLRHYGEDERELGRGSIAEYVKEILAASAEVKRVLKDDGLYWLNIGDTAVGSGGAGGDYNAGGSREGRKRFKQGRLELRPMQWANVPARVAVALQDEQDWLLRATIVWEKAGRRPEDLRHVRRPGVSHELILMLAKTKQYRFFPERLPEKGSVWHFHTGRSPHPAAFPFELPERCIAACTEPGDLVIDPFAGSGTTMRAAEALGRIGMGFDIYGPEDA